MANEIQLWKGAVEPAEIAPSGDEFQAWKGAIEPAESTDTTAPILTLPTAVATSTTTASGTVTTDEANGTLYYYMSTNATETAATIVASGSSQAVTATGSQAVSFTSLTYNTLYYAHYVHDDAATNRSNVEDSSSITTNDITINHSGTINTNTLETDVVDGGRTSILTLTGDTWIAAGTGPIGSTAQSLAIITGFTSAQSEGAGWNVEVRDKEVVGSIARTSNTVATITWTAAAAYNITAQETITSTVANAVLTIKAEDAVASPAFTVSTVADLEDTGLRRDCVRSIIRDITKNIPVTSSGGAAPPPPPPEPGGGEITATGGEARDGQEVSIFIASGGLTGVTNVAINSINCTGEAVIDDFNMTAIAPVDDLLHNTNYTLAFTGGTAGNVANVFYLPSTDWDYVEYDGLTIPPDSILIYAGGQDDTSTAAAFLTDSTAAFPTDNSWDTGFIVRNTSDGSEGPITATTATTITATLAGGTNNNWDSGDYYEVVLAIDASDQIVFDTLSDNSGTVAMTVKGVPSITGPSGTHNFDVKYRDVTDSKVSATYTYTVTV